MRVRSFLVIVVASLAGTALAAQKKPPKKANPLPAPQDAPPPPPPRRDPFRRADALARAHEPGLLGAAAPAVRLLVGRVGPRGKRRKEVRRGQGRAGPRRVRIAGELDGRQERPGAELQRL